MGKLQNYLKNKNISVYIFLLLPIIIYIIFFIIPNFSALYYSFLKWDGLNPVKEFIGLKNYIRLFKNAIFLLALKNTLIYTVTLILGSNIFGLLIALLIYRSSRNHTILRTFFFLPAMLSTVAAGFIWGFIYDPNIGAINTFLRVIGLESLTTSWLANPKIVIFSIVMVHMWVGIGYSMVLFIVGLQNIGIEIYEAAEIDGANKFQNFFHITLPLLKPTTSVCLLLTTISGFVSFDFIYIMTKGGSDHSSEVLATLLFQEGFKFSNVGYSAAISVILMIVVLIISILQIQFFRDSELKTVK